MEDGTKYGTPEELAFQLPAIARERGASKSKLDEAEELKNQFMEGRPKSPRQIAELYKLYESIKANGIESPEIHLSGNGSRGTAGSRQEAARKRLVTTG